MHNDIKIRTESNFFYCVIISTCDIQHSLRYLEKKRKYNLYATNTIISFCIVYQANMTIIVIA